MLYPRPENNPATRDKTPNLFSTKTDIVCVCVLSRLSMPKIVPHIPGEVKTLPKPHLHLSRID